jgi:hypothetical protein
VRIEEFAVEKIEGCTTKIETYDIRIMEAEEILKDRADEVEKIQKSL